MEVEESRIFFGQIVDILYHQNLNWVVEQVNEQIATGKTQPKRVRAYRETRDMPLLPMRLGAEVELAETIPYTPQEQLLILVRAVEQVVSNVADMEDKVVETFERLSGQQMNVRITFLTPNEDSPRHSISREDAQRRTSATVVLRHALLELRGRINDE